ncbi:hypothetical protein [Streptosporangium sp. NPDC048865]
MTIAFGGGTGSRGGFPAVDAPHRHSAGRQWPATPITHPATDFTVAVSVP